jgi:hypothetical protein
MYMMVRQKVEDISDLEIIKFLKSEKTRDQFLKEKGFEFHEREQVLGVGFHMRDVISDFVLVGNCSEDDKSIPYILMIYDVMYPENASSSKGDKLSDWLGKNDARLFLASALYFLKYFKGEVEAKTTYSY